MKKEAFRIIGLLYGFVGLAVTALNILKLLINQGTLLKSVNWLDFLYVSIGIILITLSLLKNEFIIVPFRQRKIQISVKKLSTMIQFWIMVLITTFGILEQHDGQYALPMVLIAGLMGLKYRILGKKILILMMIYFAALFEISAALAGVHTRGLFIILFGAFFFGIIIIMYQDDLKRHFDLAKNYHEKLISMEIVLKRFKDATLDVSQINFTPRELDVLKELCVTRASNQELADAMKLNIQTIKTHLRNIFDKSGVDDRYQLIDLFKNNFLVES
ncbi:MAG: response regulator transcription factor [Spirochaetales bacterium]|nr:response regulator transcription factor [Spirochaetales bacterium]